MKRNWIIYLDVLLILSAVAGSVYSALTPPNSLMNWFNVDDAFFYFKVAQNVVDGYGFTFDRINFSNGFHPLWMLICIGIYSVAKSDLILPLRIVVVVSGLLNAATAFLLFRFLRKRIHFWAAAAISFFWALSPSIYGGSTLLGMETGLSIFFIVLLVSMAADFMAGSYEKPVTKRQFLLLGFIGALTILARLDNLFVVATVGLFLLLKIRRIPASVLFDVIAVSLSVFIAWILRLGSEGVMQNTYTIYPMLILSVVIKPLALFFFGTYSASATQTTLQRIVRLGGAFLAACGLEFLILQLLFNLNVIKLFSYSIFVIDVALSFVFVLVVHLFFTKPSQVAARNPFSLLWSWVVKNIKPTLIGGIYYSIPIAVLVGAYMLANKMMFGTFSPVSGQVKHWWSSLENTVYARPGTLASALGLNTGGSGPWSLTTTQLYRAAESVAAWFKGVNVEIIFYLLIALVFVLFLLLMRTKRNPLSEKFYRLMLPALLAGCVVQIAYYFASGYTHTRGWYWMAESFLQVSCAALVLDGLFTWLDGLTKRVRLSPFLALLIAVSAASAQKVYLSGMTPMQVPEERQNAYLQEIHELEFHTPAGSKIGMTGGGLVSYFIKDRTIINLDGLINSLEYYEAMKVGTATQFLDEIPLDYAYGKSYMLLESDPYGGFLKKRLSEVGYIRGNEGFTLYKYIITP